MSPCHERSGSERRASREAQRLLAGAGAALSVTRRGCREVVEGCGMPTLALFADDLFLVRRRRPAMSRVEAFERFFTDFPLVSRTVRVLSTARSPLVFWAIAGVARATARRSTTMPTVWCICFAKKIGQKRLKVLKNDGTGRFSLMAELGPGGGRSFPPLVLLFERPASQMQCSTTFIS